MAKFLSVLIVLYAHKYINIQIYTQNARKKSMFAKYFVFGKKEGLFNSQEARIRRAYDSLQILANNKTATV